VDYSYYQEYSYSFPSGHSMAAVAFYGMIFYLIIRNNLSHRLFWFVAGIVFILLIGFSRIYLGVHFLTDVLAGYVLGLLWLLLGLSIIEWYKIKSKRKLNKQ
ncbi:MAG: phosphatase PAP2 family protein, partial [Saprospiraceae bacterium]